MKRDHILAHALAHEDVLAHFNSTTDGLSELESVSRLKHYGSNELGSDRKVPLLSIFIRQFRNLMVLILFAASVISFYYGHRIDTAVIVGIILLNACIGFFQEYRAEKAVAALKRLTVQKVKVYRGREIREVSAHGIVPGDIVLLEEGDRVPADGRLLSVQSLQTQESALTGESLPVDKNIDKLPTDTVLPEMHNMVFNGTIVVRGSATMVVTATGLHTALGAIAKDIEHMSESVTHFQTKSSELTRQMAAIAIFTAIITFVVGFFIQHISLESILPFTLAALVSAIPESLPLVLMIVLTLSARRMAQRNAIVRHLTAAETLGVVNVIITDKTGTLTQNNMTVERVIFGAEPPIVASLLASKSVNSIMREKLIAIASLCNSVRSVSDSTNEKHAIGDPTEKAFFSYAQSIDLGAVAQWEKLEDFPFSQTLRARACVSKEIKTGRKELFVVGAPELMLKRSTHILVNGKSVELTAKMRTRVNNDIDKLSNEAMRVISFAYKLVNDTFTEGAKNSFEGLIWAGAVGMIDPPRPEAAQSVAKAQKAGVTVIMATGDHPATALAIAKSVGISSQSYAMTAADMDELTDQEIGQKLLNTFVFARMTPQSKLRLARILQKQGKVLAMTGDGVNDAPALKGADVGVSMGKVGTDVAREASDIILADDNFATIVGAIEEGRTQFRNMRRTSFFLITTNVAESVSLLTFLFLGLPIPLLPKQVLWLNLVGGGLTDLALATEPIHEDVLQSGPRAASEKILTRQVLPQLILFTLLMTAISLLVHRLLSPLGQPTTRTGIFIVLSLMQLLNLFNMRSLKKSIFAIGVFTNKQVNGAFVISLIFLLAVVYIPPVATLFEFVPLKIETLASLAALSFSIVVLGEGIKLLNNFKSR